MTVSGPCYHWVEGTPNSGSCFKEPQESDGGDECFLFLPCGVLHLGASSSLPGREGSGASLPRPLGTAPPGLAQAVLPVPAWHQDPAEVGWAPRRRASPGHPVTGSFPAVTGRWPPPPHAHTRPQVQRVLAQHTFPHNSTTHVCAYMYMCVYQKSASPYWLPVCELPDKGQGCVIRGRQAGQRNSLRSRSRPAPGGEFGQQFPCFPPCLHLLGPSAHA